MPLQELPVIASQEVLQAAVARLAAQLSHDYQGKDLLALAVLKGAFIFLADLVRQLAFSVEIDFVRVASYGRRLHSSGRARLLSAPRTPLKGRNVLLVEDIVDEGNTVQFLRRYCREKGVASLRLCTLLVKGRPEAYPFPIEYYGLQVPNLFVVGYGLDVGEQYRNLPDVRALTPEKETVAP